MPTWIFIVHRIVVAICEHIAAEEALAGGGKDVRIDEPAHLRVIVTAVQVIESRLLGIGVASKVNNAFFLT